LTGENIVDVGVSPATAPEKQLMASWWRRLFFFVPQQQSLCMVNDQSVGNPKRKVWWV
jgi:hypothetical protein